MYFKDFPSYLYDFNYGNGETKTTVVKDITRNIRFKRDILANISLFDEYDMVDGDTPEIIAEKFYGTPEYHWVVMLANQKYDYISDFPLTEPNLQKHIASWYNPVLHSKEWWFENNRIYFKVYDNPTPFEAAKMIAPTVATLKGATTTGSFTLVETWNDLDDGFDESTQTFWFNMNPVITGTPVGELTITTEGREHNPVFFVNQQGYQVNSSSEGAIAVTGDQIHRTENDQKRKIKIISPSLLETVIKNYEEFTQ